MTPTQWTYLIFGIVIVLALIFDLGLLSKKSATISIKKALLQTAFWVSLSLAFFVYMWFEDGHATAISFLSAYLMEWSLSIDNIFVFILIFSFFKIKETSYARVLLIGILMAILFRAVFITVGAALIAEFHWLLYVFGAFLVYTGIKMFVVDQHEDFKPEENIAYRFMSKYMRITHEDPKERFVIKKHNKVYFTSLSVVVVMLAVTDIIFALDSIPAVFAISQDPLVVYTSNIFAVLGLRSLFFLLRGAVTQFDYLQQGIAIVLVFIGLKMLAEIFHFTLPIYVSLIVIVLCLGGSIWYSIYHKKKGVPEQLKDGH
ncbi:TerC/Alx family metal homeostasis membrane protein [Chitinophaga pendula]|uniref:TerC/Alx family metal homeostasis membrane protein n=1 Tax=Chitinophaga TaxID=79328 RepID=UPI000BAEAA4E|nr:MULTISPECIES: TerC/Alx family metal homeostasis membrane protein [Chitinophaga]ASZ09921.1 tellurium resistance protein TerC [Chitinophaga sp. MD30]UCJ07137.1 TerC/Alx family metal homeostasis membrane protein [Chitinophaga pendula]